MNKYCLIAADIDFGGWYWEKRKIFHGSTGGFQPENQFAFYFPFFFKIKKKEALEKLHEPRRSSPANPWSGEVRP